MAETSADARLDHDRWQKLQAERLQAARAESANRPSKKCPTPER
jgi:hypothetical protein